MIEKESTPETRREHALKNLTGSNLIMNLGGYLFVKQSEAYGKAGISAVEQYLYDPSLKEFEDTKGTIYDKLVNSRENGERGTGEINLSERKIMQDCAAIIQESLLRLKVKDVAGLVGSKANYGELGEKYLIDLASSKDEKDKEKLQVLMTTYTVYLSKMQVSEALKKSAGDTPKSLEKILLEETMRGAA